MKDLSSLVSSLRQKAEKLAEKHEMITKKNDKLSSDIAQLKEELTDKNEQLKVMNDKLSLLKIAGSVDNESTKDVKLKINEMVREIDKCIAQISG